MSKNQNAIGPRILMPEDRTYPPLLRHVIKKPEKLYYSGIDLNPKDVYIGVVGTRHPSKYGEHMAEKFSRELAEYGFVIVSGLAYGIDAIAHRAAITYHPEKRTVAVLGSGLNHIVPACNRELAKQIQKTGTILSEYKPDTPPHKGMFPQRNRIIAGMSLATLVIEAPEKSGALITARMALEYDRDVFTIPANITQESSRGTNLLIRNTKAFPITSTQDMMQILAPRLPDSFQRYTGDGINLRLPLPHLSEDENTIYELVQKSTITQEEIRNLTKFPSAKISSTLSILELKGLIQISGAYIVTTR